MPENGNGKQPPTSFIEPAPTVTLPGGRTVRLGRIKPRSRPMALRLGAYLDAAVMAANPPPDKVDYAAKAMPSLRRMYLNDRFGCCVISGKAHSLGVWSANDSDSGGLIQATDQEIYSQYQSICGPGDNGCVITDVLDAMRAKGFRAGGRSYQIDGYVAVDNRVKLQVQAGIYLFGSLTIGFDLPQAWLDAGDDGDVWDETDSRIVGGHDICTVGYNSQGVQISTWGGLRTITWKAFLSRTWISELYAILAPSWYGNDKMAPNGLQVEKLMADLSKLANGVIPDVGPPPGPTPVPPPPPTPPDPSPVPPTPPGPPEPTPALFQMRFKTDKGKGQRVSFRAPFDIPAGTYDVIPAQRKRSPRKGGGGGPAGQPGAVEID